jgi:hypothetical protein
VNVFEKFLRLERRVIYALVGACVVLPLLFPLGLRVTSSPPVRKLYEAVERLPAGTPVLISMDYDPSTTAELTPMAVALLYQCLRRHLPVVLMSLDPGGAGLTVGITDDFARETGARYGVDYCFLGYKAGTEAVILAWGEDVRYAYPTDYFNTPVNDVPLMRKIHSYRDVGLVITISAATYPELWVAFAHERYGIKVAAGVTAVMAPDYYPFLDTGQFVGMLGGLKGAAEYEQLIGRPGMGSKGMDAQTTVHVFVVLSILLGNVAYFVNRRLARRAV